MSEDRELRLFEVDVRSSRDRHPANEPEVRVATFPDGSQILVETWPSSRMTAAVRPSSWSTWGPPVQLNEAP